MSHAGCDTTEDEQPDLSPRSPHEVREYLARLGYDTVLRGTGEMPLVKAVVSPTGRRSPHITYYENIPDEATHERRRSFGWLRGLRRKGG
jgi:hypothetical protein